MNLKNFGKLITLLSLSFSASPAHAEGSGVRGGDIVLCQSGPERGPRLLDFFESSVDPRNTPTLIGKSHEEKVQDFIGRVLRVDLFMGHFLRAAWKTWSNESLLTTRVKIPNIKDSVLRFKLRDKCFLKQVAVQDMAAGPYDTRYFIDQNLWNRLSEMDKAGLVLHEMLYRFAEHFSYASVNTPYPNSENVRRFLGTMSSKRGEQIEEFEYRNLTDARGLGRRFDHLGSTFFDVVFSKSYYVHKLVNFNADRMAFYVDDVAFVNLYDKNDTAELRVVSVNETRILPSTATPTDLIEIVNVRYFSTPDHWPTQPQDRFFKNCESLYLDTQTFQRRPGTDSCGLR